MSVVYKKLEEVCEILDSQRIPITAKDRKVGQYPYYGANGLQDYVAEYIFDDELVLLAEDGGNFGSTDRPIAYRVSGKCWVNNHAHVLKAKPCIDIDYLGYSLMFYDTSGLVNGATRQKLTQAAMREMKIPYRNSDEQKEIVRKIDGVFSLIEKSHLELHHLDQLVKSRFVEMFGDPLTKTKYPKRQISDLGIVGTGNTPSMRVSEYYESEDIPFIKPGDIAESGVTIVSNADTAYISESARKAARIMPYNTVMVTCIGTIGKVGIVQRESACNQQINYIIPNALINSMYLAQCLSFYKPVLEEMANAPVVPIINKTQFSTVALPVPPLELQNRFAAFVTEVDKSKLAVKQSLEKLETLKKSLMQQYFG